MKVLHFILYDKLFPPRNGGMLRCWNIMEQISKYYDVDVVTSQNDIVDQLQNSGYSIPETAKFLITSQPNDTTRRNNYRGTNKIWLAIKYRWYYRTLSSTDSSLLNILPLFRSIRGNHYDMVVFEHLESLRLHKIIRSLFPKAFIVLDAHNVDHILLSNSKDKRRLKRIGIMESTLYKYCDLVLAVSDKDAKAFKKINKKELNIIIIPNGVDTNLNSWQLPDFLSVQKKIIFCGSLDYEPNQLGLTWFINNVWERLVKKHPDLIFLVVGKGEPGNTLANLLHLTSNINYIGEVDNVIPYYRQAQCAVVPILQGSGTRLKILEAMSLGVPVISTSVGAEGIAYCNRENIFICNEPDEYLYWIDKLYEDVTKFINVSENGSGLVRRNYSWNIIGKSLNKELEKLAIKSF